MTLATITSLICVLLNISYIIALLIVCVRKRNVETMQKEKSEQYKAPEPAKSSEANRKELFGPSLSPKVTVTKGIVAVVAADVPKQVLQQSSAAANQMQQAINDLAAFEVCRNASKFLCSESLDRNKFPTAFSITPNPRHPQYIQEHTQATQLSKERIEGAKDGQKNLLQRIKDMKERNDGQIQCKQYKSVKRRKKAMKKGIKLETAQTQRSNETEEEQKKDKITKAEEEEEEEEEGEDDTMKGIASLQQDLNIVSAEE
ncbi:hypothetical protein ACH3XW_0065 [Acanthocheilonema viteae]